MEKDPGNDYTAEFRERARRFRPWGLILLVWLVTFFSLPIILFAMELLTRSRFTLFMALMTLLLIPPLVKTIRLLRCPSCGRFMGRDLGLYCPMCGVKIREENK